MNLIYKIKKILSWIFSSKRRILVSILIVLVIGFFIVRSMIFNGSKITYQTSPVLKDTLVVSLSESGFVAVANRMPISTQASGLVSQVYVSNGDTVEKGQKIADITLDSAGVQKQASAYASYLSAQSSLNKANADMFSTQSTMYSAWDKYTAIAQNSTYQNSDGSPNTSNRTLPEFTTSQDNWLAAEANYKNQQTVVFQAQAALTSAWSSYQESSSEIVAPVAGIISDLTIAPGMQLSSGSSSSSSSSSNSSTNSSINVASIKVEGKPVITINLSEADVVKVHANQKATVTFDALGDLTFTGRVLGINTTGSVSSGVTSYPATIVLDSGNDKILPNMSASASIITNVKPDVLLVPNAAVQTLNGQSTVRVMKNGKVAPVPVEIGQSSDTQTEITSGLSEGEEVVTSVSGGARSTSSTSTSPFGAGLRGGFGGNAGGGNFIRVGTGGGR